jgi:hypothetical protein
MTRCGGGARTDLRTGRCVQRLGSRTVHRVVFRIRDGQRTAAKYQGDNDGIPDEAHTHGITCRSADS